MTSLLILSILLFLIYNIKKLRKYVNWWYLLVEKIKKIESLLPTKSIAVFNVPLLKLHYFLKNVISAYLVESVLSNDTSDTNFVSLVTFENRNISFLKSICSIIKSSHPEVFLGKGVLKICMKFTGEHPCRSAISIKFQSNFIESHIGMGVLL